MGDLKRPREYNEKKWYKGWVVKELLVGCVIFTIVTLLITTFLGPRIERTLSKGELSVLVESIESDYFDGTTSLIPIGEYLNGSRMLDKNLPFYKNSIPYKFSILKGRIEVKREKGKVKNLYFVYMLDKSEKSVDKSDFVELLKNSKNEYEVDAPLLHPSDTLFIPIYIVAKNEDLLDLGVIIIEDKDIYTPEELSFYDLETVTGKMNFNNEYQESYDEKYKLGNMLHEKVPFNYFSEEDLLKQHPTKFLKNGMDLNEIKQVLGQIRETIKSEF